jgi:hypothetical protein
MISFITESVYGGLTAKEKENMEDMTRSFLNSQRSSVRSNYPRWRLQHGFSRQTLMTSTERVGSLFALSLSIHHAGIRSLMKSAHARQINKYQDTSGDDEEQQPQFFFQQHMQYLDSQVPDPPKCNKFNVKEKKGKPCKDVSKTMGKVKPTAERKDTRPVEYPLFESTLRHMVRHGFNLEIMDHLDVYQVNQMISHCAAEVFKTTQYPASYPLQSIEGVYTEFELDVPIPEKYLVQFKKSMQPNYKQILSKNQCMTVADSVPKHFLKKTPKKGDGPTSAVLCKSIGTLLVFLEVVLCFHAYCKYSTSLPQKFQNCYETIQAGNQYVIEYFQKIIYRGDATVDSRTPKIHSQCRMPIAFSRLKSLMNACCELGERLLKTEAKGIARTAQQRSNGVFECQVMDRIQERVLLDSFGVYVDSLSQSSSELPNLIKKNQFARKHPNFVFAPAKGDLWACDRKYKEGKPNKESGFIDEYVLQYLKEHEPDMAYIDIYNEVILRDGGMRVRASPNYNNSGPWYDFVNVKWDSGMFPAKCLCFYRKFDQGCSKFDQGCSNYEMKALIHSVDDKSLGRVTGKMNTLLTYHYNMLYDRNQNPKLHVVDVASIDSAVICYPHQRSNQMFNAASPGIMYIVPRNQWAYIWLATTQVLQKKSDATSKGKKIALGDQKLLDLVRSEYQQMIE